MFEVVF
jgi:hypothetical protein